MEVITLCKGFLLYISAIGIVWLIGWVLYLGFKKSLPPIIRILTPIFYLALLGLYAIGLILLNIWLILIGCGVMLILWNMGYDNWGVIFLCFLCVKIQLWLDSTAPFLRLSYWFRIKTLEFVFRLSQSLARA
ncbi:MAG: hypothetical protein B6244_11855 [Candidatus Cloacimonetes bacterium 4572_55]|nr:MAG: hypothetical protein B6244_11855 [Candidatus Cloacimonetes bacterium 4572_55]